MKITAVYVLVSMILGGIMTALYSCLNRLEIPFESLQGDGLSVWLFAALMTAAGLQLRDLRASTGAAHGSQQRPEPTTRHSWLTL